MERLSPAALPRRTWIWSAVGVVLLLSGPQNLARVVSLLSSLVMWPFTRRLEFAGGGYEVANLELMLVYLVVVLGMNVFVQSGLFSLGHTVFFAIGGYTVGVLTVEHAVSFWLALPCGIVLAGLVGLVLGLPAGRLGAFTFAMITLGYAIVVNDLILDWDTLTGAGEGILGIGLPAPFTDLEGFYWFVAAVVAVAFFAARYLLRSPYGRAAKAVEASSVAAQSLGINPALVKVRAFGISAAFAGTGGGVFAALQGLLSPSSFSIDLAILFLLMVLLGGSGTVAGPVIGAVLLFRLPLAVESVTDRPGEVSLLVYGLVLVASVYVVPRGLMSAWWRLRAWLSRRRSGPESTADASEREGIELAAVIERVDTPGGTALSVRDARLALGGVKALDGVSLRVEPGTVHALIGPNGSGKTTLLNVISGYLEPDSGHLEIMGQAADRLAAHRRPGLGVGRTFQTPYVFTGISCAENVLVAIDRERGVTGLGHLAYPLRARREEHARYRRALELLDAVGLAHRAADDAGDLPPGERRLLELARLLALRPGLVLLDEPAGGLNAAEIGHLEDFVRVLRAARVAVLLVEHRIDMVMRLADEVTVLEFGRDISHGDPAEVRRDPAVVAAYLGEQVEDEESSAPAAGPWTGGGTA